MSLDNNPAGSPPVDASASTPNIEDDILEVLSLNGSAADADAIANKGGEQTPPNEPPAGAASPSPLEAPGVEPAPTPGDTSPPAAPEAPQPFAAPAPSQGTPPAPAAPAPTEPQPAAPQPAPNEEALRTASLEAQVAELTRTIEQLRATPQPAAAPATPAAPTSPEQPAGPQPYRYALTLPDQVKNALMSDDPQQNIAAINSIINDLGTIVHNTVLAQMRSEVQGLFQGLTNMAAEQTSLEQRQSAQEAGRTAYFNKFPAHKEPLIQPIITSENAKLAAQYPNAPFDDNYINALGARVNGVLEQLGAKPAEAPQSTPPAPNPAPPARPATMLPSGNRSAPVTPSGDISDEIIGVLDPFA